MDHNNECCARCGLNQESILLVSMVLAICLWQRAGFGSTCPVKADYFTHQQDASESTDTECELSNHLIQAQSQLIEPGILLTPL